jgi:hypothetical protein
LPQCKKGSPACASSEVHVRHSVNGRFVTEPIARRARAVGPASEDFSGRTLRPHWLRPPWGRPFADPAHLECVGMRRVRPTSACASALGPATALSGTTSRTRHRRSDRVHALHRKTRLDSEAAKWGHDRSDASLEVLVPSALACHAARVPGAATRTGDPASTVDRLHTPPPSPLMPCRHRSPTRGGVRSVLAVFRVAGVGPIDSARIDAARFDRDAPVLSRRVAASGASPAAGHAPAPFCGRRSATREAVHVAWSVPFRRREASWFSVP